MTQRDEDFSSFSVKSIEFDNWFFRDTSSDDWHVAEVPGCVHKDLLRVGLIEDPFWSDRELELKWIEDRDWEYQTTFNVDPMLLDESVVELVADGLDTVATVVLNGTEIAKTDNMFIAHRWDVKPFLRSDENILCIRFRSSARHAREVRKDYNASELNDPEGRAPVIRKQQCQFGWDWGPRFVTTGIWKSIRLEAWRENRLKSVRVSQIHNKDDCSVELELVPEMETPDATLSMRTTLKLKGKEILSTSALRFNIPDAQLWWPNGQGRQPLYDLAVTVFAANGTPFGCWHKKIGLRTIQLQREPDEFGESFQFMVNGRAVFAKGANWIPAHAFVAGLQRKDYKRDLLSATQANMNMIRVWGGGIYEDEAFYDLCDELGLLVWQDFMFACAAYPGDDEFLDSVENEAIEQVQRLRHRACLALWCGNNEIELHCQESLKTPEGRRDYDRIFEKLLPDVVARLDGVTDYWPSSPHRPDGDNTHESGEKQGDSHFWEVWHARKPVKTYEKWKFRFCSEFGMQSYSSPETNATFCPPTDRNIFGPSMENHQKNRGGNQVILDYVTRRYRYPKSQDDLIYLSQLNQAYCMQTAVEHFRRLMPRCMGTLYWQLNDCWPVASWSSIEYTGRWRALHYQARRFYSPALVSAHVLGDEEYTVGNYRKSTIRAVDLYTVYDAPSTAEGVLRWDLFQFSGEVVLSGEKTVVMDYGSSVLQQKLDLGKALDQYGRDHVYLRIALELENGGRVSEETVFFAPPRFLELPRASVSHEVRLVSPEQIEITFVSSAFQHRFHFNVPGVSYFASDDYFELYPNEPKTIELTLFGNYKVDSILNSLTYHSLVDTYL